MKIATAMAAAVYLVAVIGLSGSPEPLLAQASRTQWDGVYTDLQAKRGEDLYGVICAYCHGPELEGGSSGADVGPALKGRTFVSAWNKRTVNDLFTLIVKSMPQDRPGSVTPQETADLVAFLLLKNDAPVGASELPAQPDVLNTIGFLATKP